MATQEDRSLGSGISLPRFFKNSRMNGRFDFDQSTFSPTELDDSFMLHYLHPVGPASQIRSKSPSPAPRTKIIYAQDVSKHPPACQKFLQGDVTPPPQTTPQMKIKSSGVDDGFKGEAAKCGSSIVKVASQIVSGKVINTFESKESGDCEQNMTYTRRRRNSKSLPASPLTSPHGSPKLNRKVTNRYFTAAFTDSVGSTGGSWILSNLLARRGVSASVGHIGEETSEEMERSSSLASVDESSGMKTPVFKARPSELREMNFWSPTSM
ncbi:unnamed protein product [Callosobruchus maculatus]|uniref:Uncharacterized protein n=1 Tax=Callosobruchus maculatus TaxID=64391 RepID=A0A653BX70_CALMS|nr:unnamed protein product [Callosobruchus maculatus]